MEPEPLTEYSHLPADVRRHIAGFYEWAYHNQRLERERIEQAKFRLMEDQQRHLDEQTYSRRANKWYERHGEPEKIGSVKHYHQPGLPPWLSYSDPMPSKTEKKIDKRLRDSYASGYVRELNRYHGGGGVRGSTALEARKAVLLKTRYPRHPSGPDQERIYREGLENARAIDARHKAQQAVRNK